MGELTTSNRKLTEAQERLRPAGEVRALESAKLLLGAYPRREVKDAAVYVRMLTVAFQRYPADLHLEAIDRLTNKLKWLPTKADVVEVLEDIVTPRRLAFVRERKRAERPRRTRELVKPEVALAELEKVKAALKMPESVTRGPPTYRPIHVDMTDEQREAMLRKFEGA